MGVSPGSAAGIGSFGRLGPGATFVLLVVANTLMWAVDDVWYARIGHKTQGYEYAVTSVLYPITYSLLIWPIVGVLICRGHIPRESRSMPLWKMAAIAGMNGVANLVGFFPVSHLGGAFQTVIGTNVPEVMLCSWLILGARYKLLHGVGVVLIIGGIALTVEQHLAHTTSTANMGLWVIMILAIRLIPSAVLEEKWLKQHDTSVWYFKAMESLFEIVTGLCLVVTLFLQVPGTPHVSPSSLGSYFSDAFGCFAGATSTSDGLGEHCTGTWALWIPFMLLDIVTDVIAVLITKHYSAATSIVVSAVVLPVQTLLFQVHFISGIVTQDGLQWSMVVGLIAVCSGIVVYRCAPEQSNAVEVRPPSLARRSSNARQLLRRSRIGSGDSEASYAAYTRMTASVDDARSVGSRDKDVRRVSIAMSTSVDGTHGRARAIADELLDTL